MDEHPGTRTTQGPASGGHTRHRRAERRGDGGLGAVGALRRLPGLVARRARDLLGLGLPVSCAGCGCWETRLCPQCRSLLGAGTLLVEHAEAAGDLEILAAATYAGPVRSLVLGWKNGAREDLDGVMSEVGRELGRACASHLASHPDLSPAEHGGAGRDGSAAASALLVIPAPSGAGRRLRGRLVAAGLADAVARGIAEHGSLAGGPVLRVLSADVLRRRGGAGAHQAGRSAHQRRANRAAAPRVLAEVRGLPVVLVDDVVTTGATLESCVRALEEAGAHVLAAVVLAATPPPGGGGARRIDGGGCAHPAPAQTRGRAGDVRHVRHRRSVP
ncbi:ComF family protein [Actinomyces capricornis]|uniref:Phosphoribosyltransferase domain-containing protein n=1 Tax=Actinomyces capricornis TaxID=2755559 RepID=A0ABM7U869_9ACTO|nr:phosphoribosyltransferase family protein [Actinomyces capricornis]BDA63650.1 hypothetical protein MANAM107_04840 [Actinomyces capricornis]